MRCNNKGLWHLGISEEACSNAGGKWIRTPCMTLKETIDDRPHRFDLETEIVGGCREVQNRLVTTFVSASSDQVEFPFEITGDGCVKFCESLPDYSSQIGMIKHRDASGGKCTCLYPNGKLPSRELLPPYATLSPPKFTLTRSDGLALGVRPLVSCNATDDLTIETQVSNPSDPRQQFEITQDGRIVSSFCPEKVLTAAVNSN